MPPNPPLQIVFPKLGVVRRLPVRPEGRQEAFATPWSYNVRLEDILTGRLRGGSFKANLANARPESIVYRDRTLTFSGRAITGSRVADSADIAMSADLSDMLRPALFQFSEAGELGADVVALVPHKDSQLLCFMAAETWVHHGDPLSGSRSRVSDQVGIVGPDAWCVAHDAVYFLSSRGLYSVMADGTGLKALSEDVLPEDLIGVDDDEVMLDYDHASRGVSIHQRAAPSWFYDTARGGFWPIDTTTEQSHLLLGPLHIGRENSYGRILNLQGNMATGSDDVTWRLVTGDTAEDAVASGKSAIEAAVAGEDYSSYVAATGVWSEGRSHMAYPRTRAIWCCIWLSAVDTWAFEALAMTRVPSGKWR